MSTDLVADQARSASRNLAQPIAFRRGPGQASPRSGASTTEISRAGSEPAATGTGVLGGLEIGIELHRALAGMETRNPEALRLAARFRESDLGQRVASASRVEHEFDFLVDLDGVLVSGQIDLWFEHSGETVLVDYKTGAEDPAHEVQVRLYALALERYLGRLPDTAVLAYLRSGTTVDVSLLPHHLDAAREAATAFANAPQDV